MRNTVVPEGVRAILLARYLSRAFPLCPSHIVRNALKRRDVRVNGVRASERATVSGGDRLAIYIDEKYLTAPARVLYQDGRVLAAEKPQGLPMDADADGIGEDTLLTRVRAQFPDARLCHRLDAATGGVALLALTKDAYANLTEDFRCHRIEKVYHCLVGGTPEKPEGSLAHYLVKDAEGAKVRVTGPSAPGAMRATLKYRVLETRAHSSLLEIELGTGRTHQIRVQMAAIGHPILGDDKYGDRTLNKCLSTSNLALWCVKMRLPDGREFLSSPNFA